jgi:hypothetical protein
VGRSKRARICQLGGVGAHATGHAKLARNAIAVGLALVAALVVDRARLAYRALAIVSTRRLGGELAYVVGAVAFDAILARRAIAVALALVVAKLKRADEGRVAIGIDGATAAQLGRPGAGARGEQKRHAVEAAAKNDRPNDASSAGA